MASSSGIKLGRAYVLIDAVDRTKQACNAALRNISTLADNFMAIGTNLTIGATIAVTLDASASRAFREFEETMLKVKAKSKDTAGATVAAYDRLIEKAQQLGRVTKFTAPQIADAMAGMAAAGLSRSAIDKSIKNVLDLAVATGVEIPTASRIAMAAMQQFNMTAEQSAEICDVLSAAVNNSALTIEDIGETFKYSAPLAREFGMDMKQLATVIAALGNAGIKGSQAGTSLRQMMVKLAKPGKYNLDKFNQDFEANVQRDIVVNEGGVLRKKTRPVIEILRDMGKAMDEFEKKHPDVDPQKKLAVFADLFGRYAMTSGATLADNMKNLDTLMKAINNSSGTAGKTAEIMNSGVVGMHYAFISAWQDVAIQYGKAINETVMTFYEGFTKIAHYISNFIQNNQNVINIITGVTAATGALGVSMIAGAGAVKTFAVVGGMFTSTVGAMSSAAYGFAIALNSWINPLISVQGLMRGLVATIAGTTVVGRGIGGVISSFGSRWNLPWQNAPAGARRLTRGQAARAARMLAAYHRRVEAGEIVPVAREPRPRSPMRGLAAMRPNAFFNNSLTRDFGRNNQFLRERMRLLRLAGFYDMTPMQRTVRSAEIIRTRRLMTANNMMLGRQRWGAFFRPFTDALQRATRAVGQFGMQTWGAIRRIGIHPIAGARSLIANAGSMLFAGLAPGGGIMKGIGATFKFAFTYLKRGLVPVMQTLLRLAVQFATAPLTWAAGLTYATLQGGKLKEVMAGVYIAISAIGVGVSKLWGQLKNLFSWLGKSIKENMAQSNAIIDPVIDMWKGTFSRLFDDMKGSFSVITEAIGAGRWGDAFKVLGAQWRVIRAELSATLRNNWEHMKYTFMTVWNRVVDYFQNGEGLWGIVKWLVGGLWNVTKWAIGELYKAITTFWAGEVQIGDATVYNGFFKSNNSAYESMKTIFDEYNKRGIKYDAKLYPIFDAAVTAETFGRSPELTGIKDELTRLIAQARNDINGENVIVPTPKNFGGWGYTADEIEEQRKRAMDDTGAIKSVADDPDVVEARNNLAKIEQNTRGNVERQKAAEAAKQLKEREEGVVKELGEEGVGRIGEILEGFYDFSDTDDNRKKGLILAAGEYITEMGISIDKFAEIIETLKKIPGFGLANTGMYSSEKSNVEYYANMADEVVRAGMDALMEGGLRDSIEFTLKDKAGNPVTKTLNRIGDNGTLSPYERLKELGNVLATLTPEQKRDVRKQLSDKYGEDATSAIENALDAMYQRGAKVDFTDEENLYRHNLKSKTEYGKMSQYERERFDKQFAKLQASLDTEISDENLEKMKEATAGIRFAKNGMVTYVPQKAIFKEKEYGKSFGGTATVREGFIPQEQIEDMDSLFNGWNDVVAAYGGGNLQKGRERIQKDGNAFAEFALQAGDLGRISGWNVEQAGNYIYGINNLKSKDLDKKVKYYGGDVEGLTNMEKLSLVKEREGVAGLMKFLPKQGAMFEKSKDFANWLKAPEENKKPQVWTVVQANIKDMLSTFKAFADNRNRVILDRRAKEEKDAKAKEEEAKKARGEDIEGRLKSIEDGIDNLSACVDGNGSKRFNINMEYA